MRSFAKIIFFFSVDLGNEKFVCIFYPLKIKINANLVLDDRRRAYVRITLIIILKFTLSAYAVFRAGD
jgi:hypothetical protein